MKKFAGIWLDHRKAVVVSLLIERQSSEPAPESIARLESDMERKVKLSGGSRTRATPYGPQDVTVDGKMEERIKKQLKQYYQGIIKKIENVDRIYLFGPGEAKNELKKEIAQKRNLAAKDLDVETADKMTDKQIAARVREFFAPHM